jgi:UDP-GlcNAc:undecaprenyl-phosphate GlcNAc-1-phosphate transferase
MVYVGIAAFLVAMGATWIVTPGVIRLAGVLGAVDLPGGRKTHREPMPRIGGLAVFFGFVAGMLFAAAATGNLFTFPQTGVYWRGLAYAATGLLVVGLLDDLYRLSYLWKFAAQIAAAVYVWNCGFRIETISHPLGGGFDLQWLALPITLLWIVGITNAVNLIDGLDGLAVGIALITTSAVAVIAFVRGELGVTAASVTLAGSLIGFLRFNFSPARIFLGDSGSLFLGFVLAVTSVRGSQKGPTAVAILVPLLVLGLPLLDTGLAVVRRLYRLGEDGARRENTMAYVLRNLNRVFLPDRQHIHHRLIDLGLSHRAAVLVLYIVGLTFALAAFAMTLLKSLLVAVLLGLVLLVTMASFFALLYLRVWRVEDRGGEDGPLPRPPAPKREPLAPTTGNGHGR